MVELFNSEELVFLGHRERNAETYLGKCRVRSRSVTQRFEFSHTANQIMDLVVLQTFFSNLVPLPILFPTPDSKQQCRDRRLINLLVRWSVTYRCRSHLRTLHYTHTNSRANCERSMVHGLCVLRRMLFALGKSETEGHVKT